MQCPPTEISAISEEYVSNESNLCSISEFLSLTVTSHKDNVHLKKTENVQFKVNV